MKYLRTFFRVSIACFCLSFCALSAYAQNAGDSIKIHLTNGEIVGIDAFDIDTIKHSPTTMQVQLWNDSIVTYPNVDIVKVEFDPLTAEEIKAIQEKERNALIAIYNALDGDTWETNTNWCSDIPFNYWENVHTTNGFVTSLYIIGTVNQNTKRGHLPKEVEDLQYLSTLHISHTNLDSLPLEIAHLPRLRHFFSTDNIFLHLSEITPLYQLKNLETLDITINPEHFNISESAQTPIPFPVEIGKLKNLKSLSLNDCNLSGTIPDDLWTWVQLESIVIHNMWSPHLSGTIPSAIGNLKKLQTIDFYNVHLSGGIPEELYTLTELINLEIDNCGIGGELSPKIKNLTKLNFLNLRECALEGTLPSELSELLDKELNRVLLTYNNFTGDIPESITQHPKWASMWSSVITGNKFNVKASDIPAPQFDSEDVFGNYVHSNKIYKNNKYTILYEYDVAVFPSYYSIAAYPCNQMHALYNMYHNAGVELVMFADQFEEDIQEFVTRNNIPWTAVRGAPWGMSVLPNVNIIDSTQTVVLSTLLEETANKGMDTIIQFFAEKFPEIQPYTSIDYSNDGKVEIIQQATQGNGIDIILMGDGYSDRQIAVSDYDKDIDYAIEHLFTEEPYKSFKDYFNIYVVTAVSQNEGYEHFGSTAFNCYFGGGTAVGGNNEKVLEYAQKAISAERMDNANIIVLMNKDEYAGMCHMYYPTTNNDYGSGTSISYFPVSRDAATFAGLLHHEALGHGCAKLDDEYAYEEMGAAPNEYITARQQVQTNYGWMKNVDFTSDLAAIRWNYFLNDPRYASEGLGAFEGASTYWTGVWRPTENSIMRYNTGGYNAPSREAIYYRIHKLAYGEDWEYNYEDFVAYDAINRTPAAAARRAVQRRAAEGKVLPPSTPPVVIPHSWREAKQDSTILQRKVLQPKVTKLQLQKNLEQKSVTPQKGQEKQVEKKQEFKHTPPPVVIPHSWNEKK